jgi:hypothetical protein
MATGKRSSSTTFSHNVAPFAPLMLDLAMPAGMPGGKTRHSASGRHDGPHAVNVR